MIQSIALGLVVLLAVAGCGGGGSGGGGSNTPSVPQNAAPVISVSPSSPEVIEGFVAVAEVSASDSNGDTVTLSLSGTDADLFQLDSDGQLTFAAVPNFEDPQDGDANNVYSVTINANDGKTTSTKAVSVEVLNALEGRVVDAPLSGATVCITSAESTDCSESAEQTLTDDQGYYLLPVSDTSTLIDASIRSIGGTDIVSKKVLGVAAFLAPIPTDQSASIAITPLSTLLAKSDNPDAVLTVLGVPDGVTVQTLLAMDPWLISTESAGDANEFKGLTDLATTTGLDAATLSTLALDVLVASSQITNLILIANELISDTTTSGIQTAAERAVMVSDEVMDALVKQIAAAGASAQGRQKLGGASFSFSDATVINTVLKETVKETATTIVETIEKKQTDGSLDLSSASADVVAAVNAVKQTAEVVQQAGVDTTLVTKIAKVATATAQSNTVVESLITTGGAAALSDEGAASAIARIVTNTVTQTAAYVDDEIDETEFEAETDAQEQANKDESLGSSLDTDKDGIPNTEDTDDDGDGVLDVDDAFELDATESKDTDKDGIGNNADTDDDGDGVLDADDAFELDATESKDTDKDGIGNNADTDDDGDGVLDADDAFELDATESKDTDKDGIGNNADTDDDDDGLSDEAESAAKTDPLDADSDDDGALDGLDAFPLDGKESVDTDGDQIGNNEDTDDDGDGIEDAIDLDPTDKNIPAPCVWGASNWGECKWQ